MYKTAEWKKRAHAKSAERRRLARLRRQPPTPIFGQWARQEAVEVLEAPQTFLLHNAKTHDEVALFLVLLRQAFTKSGLCVLDLRSTDRLMPGAMLLLYAELSRLTTLFPDKRVKFVRSRDSTVNEVFEHLGIFGRFGFRSGVKPERDDVVTWKVVSAVTNDGPLAGGLLEAQESLSKAELRHVFKGVSEAVPNAVEHAYIGPRHDGLPEYEEKRWWMFCRETEQKLYVGVCDLGVGIPVSLPKTAGEALLGVLMDVLSLGTQKDDASMIRAAMELSRTRTKQDERGKGFGDMRQVVDQIPGSDLYIFSNRGLVSYRDGAFRMSQRRYSIFGTLVVWIIPVTGEADEQRDSD